MTDTPDEVVTIPLADYERMKEALECDESIEWCEVCGAWLDLNDPARATTEDFRGCWKAATRAPENDHLCRSYRADVPVKRVAP